MATTYTGQITGKHKQTGEVFVQYFTSTDVASSYWLFPNNGGNNFITVPRGMGGAMDYVEITDVSVSNATQTEVVGHLRASQADTGVAFSVPGMLNTINNRMPTPWRVRGGSTVMVQVKTT